MTRERTLRRSALALVILSGMFLQGCVVGAVAGATVGVASTAVGMTAKAAGTAVGVGADAVGAAGKIVAGGKN